MFTRLMEVIQEQEEALIAKVNSRHVRNPELAQQARLDVVAVFNAIKSQVRASERTLVEVVTETALRTRK